jgi:hypothetical protein
MSPKPGEETYITPLETAILLKIGTLNSTIREAEVIAVLSTLIQKLKGKVTNEDI